MRKAPGVVFAFFLALIAELAVGGSCGPPPPAKPHRRTGGESFPPLPLPATPLRRTEKKRPPAPPALVAKVRYGKLVEGVDEAGRPFRYLDWTTDPSDVYSLMNRYSSDIGVRRRAIEVTFEDFSFDPTEIPVLYLTGHEGVELTREIRAKLRAYLQAGGSLICDACCGSEEYLKAWVREMSLLFPHRKAVELPGDHPVFGTVYRIAEVGYQVEGKGRFKGPPVLLGISIGCRTAVFLTPYDLSCGWDGHQHERGKRVWPAEDARRLGVNMLAYAQAFYGLGRFLAVERVYFEAGESAGQKLVMGQVIHGGDWDPDPSGPLNLLKHVQESSTLDVRFRREAVDLAGNELFKYPVLHMTGHDGFTFRDEEVVNLRKYLKLGGFLLADACCGRLSFDRAFRREMARVLPEAKLGVLPLDHELFSALGDPVREVRYKPAVRKTNPELKVPVLEGMTLEGTLAVVYSRFDLGCGWEIEECPFCRGVEPKDALRLGANILVYCMTH